MKIIRKLCINIMVVIFFTTTVFSYTLTTRDYKTIEKVENKIYNIIDNNDNFSAKQIVNFLKKYIQAHKKFPRVSQLLGYLINNIEYKYYIGIHSNYKDKYKLLPPENGKIYFGAFPDFGGPEDIVTEKRIKDFETLAKTNIGWAYFSQNWFNGIKYPKKSIHAIENTGSIPFVRLMPRSDEEQFKKEKIFNLQNIIDGNFDKDIRQWAKESKKDFEDTNIPLLVDFAVEANGDWFSWSGKYNGKDKKNGYGNEDYFDGPEKYRDAYRHIIDIFREENVKHITWFFHADIYSMPDTERNKAKYYYPGDDYIDWIGVSIYGPQNTAEDYWETFSEILQERYKSILEISKNKPIAILEFGVTDNHPLGKKDKWLENAFETILNEKFLNFQAISYWNENWEEDDNIWANIRIDSSKKALDTFQKYSQNNKFTSRLLFSNYKKKPELPSNILFKSDFEEGTYIEHATADDGGIWWQKIKGSDINNFVWPINILGYKGILQLIVDNNKDINNYIENKIETVIGINNKKTKALHQIIKKKQYGWTQDPYIIYTDGNEIQNLYIKYSLKFPANMSELLGKDGWAVISEFKTTGDYRLALYVYKDKQGKLYWYMHGDNVVLDDVPYKEFWHKENRKIEVPTEKWFDMEIYWNRSTKDDGRVWWAIDGKTIADYNGPTKIKDPIDAIMVFTNYASKPFHQWIDNIEIRYKTPTTTNP